MGGLKSIGKKIKKFFKKLGKQIKTNLKHGAKYIAPVLLSAMTGGFGSGIVKSLFGNKFAGALSKLGNNTIGKLFGGRASTAALPGAAEGAEAVADTVGLAAEPTLGGSAGISNIVKNALTPVLSGAGNTLPGISNAASLVSSNPILGAADKLLGAVVTNGTVNGMTGALAKTYGGANENMGNTGSSGGSSSKADLAELFSKINANKPGDDARTIEVDPNNISGIDKNHWQNPDGSVNPEVLDREMRLAFKNNREEDEEEEDQRFKTSGYRRYVPMNYGTGRRF